MPPPSAAPRSSRGRRGWTACGSASASFPCPRWRCRRGSRGARASACTRGAAAAPSGRCVKPRRPDVRVTALAGGTGAAKLLRGLAAILEPSALSVVVNTGDDAEVWGLHVSPDLDSVMYALAGVLNPARGWGRADETFRCLSAMAVYGAPTWFALGDRDLATHLVRTRALREGRSLSAITADLCRALGVAARLSPMSDDAVRTTIRPPEGRLGFQEFL